jgi:lipopolysaccharide transport system ATP-binding protein
MPTAVSVRELGKRYRHSVDRPRTWKDAALRGFREMRGGKSFWALRGVSFEVPAGKTVGLIGPNGAGKSTLLRLVGGVGRPNEGRVSIRGRLGAIFELGAGFHPDLSGRESAILGGLIAGLTRRDVFARLDDIVGFAELESFIDDPVRTYSSGMVARLAFSVATHVDAEVLLIDEVLAVGDIRFQERCLERLRSFQKAGVTMLIVSHAPQMLSDFCDEVIWLVGGAVIASGAPHEVAERYRQAMSERVAGITPSDLPDAVTPAGQRLRVHENRIGSQDAQLTSVELVDKLGAPVTEISSGDPLVVRLSVELPDGVGDANVAVHLVNADGVLCLDTSTPLYAAAQAGRRRSVRLELDRLDLVPGSYEVEVGLYAADWGYPYDFHWCAYPFGVVGEPRTGLLAPPAAWVDEQPHAGS